RSEDVDRPGGFGTGRTAHLTECDRRYAVGRDRLMQVMPERAVGENKRQGVGWCVAAAALMVAFCAAAPAMMQTLAAIGDSSAVRQESLRLLGRMLAGVVLVWALVVGAGWRSDIRRLKRVSRAGPLVAGAGLVFWWLPIPFGPTRL